MTAPRYRFVSTILMALPVCAGCSREQTRIQLTTYDQAGQAQQHFSNFERASFRQSAGGLIEVVLQTQRPSSLDPTQLIQQILYIKSFWNPVPGTTYVEATQINSKIEYAVLTLPTGVRYDGAAFLTYKLDRKAGELIGRIESATLTPKYRLGDAAEPFGPARVTGTIRAEENPREIVNAAQALETAFRGGVPTTSASN